MLSAYLQRELDSFEDSFNTLSAAVEKDPYDPQLLVALATECLYAEQVSGAECQNILQASQGH